MNQPRCYMLHSILTFSKWHYKYIKTIRVVPSKKEEKKQNMLCGILTFSSWHYKSIKTISVVPSKKKKTISVVCSKWNSIIKIFKNLKYCLTNSINNYFNNFFLHFFGLTKVRFYKMCFYQVILYLFILLLLEYNFNQSIKLFFLLYIDFYLLIRVWYGYSANKL